MKLTEKPLFAILKVEPRQPAFPIKEITTKTIIDSENIVFDVVEVNGEKQYFEKYYIPHGFVI